MTDGMASRPRNGLSLCSGGAGLDMGLMLAEPGFHTRCFVEWEEYPRQSIVAAQRAGYFTPAPIWDDVTTFDGRPRGDRHYPRRISLSAFQQPRTAQRDDAPPLARCCRIIGEVRQNGSFSKMSRSISPSALKPYCATYGQWAGRLRLAYSQRLKQARRMKPMVFNF